MACVGASCGQGDCDAFGGESCQVVARWLHLTSQVLWLSSQGTLTSRQLFLALASQPQEPGSMGHPWIDSWLSRLGAWKSPRGWHFWDGRRPLPWDWMTMLLVFRARLRLGSNVPSHWEFDRSDFVCCGTCIWASKTTLVQRFMMPNCKDEERSCRAYMQWQVVWKEITASVGFGHSHLWGGPSVEELRERVRHVRGTKDPITMLRFLRARQGSRQLKEVALEVGVFFQQHAFFLLFLCGGASRKVAAMTAVWFHAGRPRCWFCRQDVRNCHEVWWMPWVKRSIH